MKILNLKYKMHKLVNLLFYFIVFGIGFLFGFGLDKINFNNIISQFLFIENVNAEELICTEEENLFDINQVSNTSSFVDKPADFSILGDKLIVEYSNAWTFVDFEIYLQSGTYNVYIDSITGAMNKVEIWKIIYNSDGTFYYEYINPLRVPSLTFELSEKTHIMLRFYNSNGNYPYKTEYVGLRLHKQICKKNVTVDIVNDSFYSFSQKIFGEVSEENKFIYDFITFSLIVTCFTLFILIVGYIMKKFFGG